MIVGFGQVSEEKISDFERHIGFSLPNDYRNFLLMYNGGTPYVKYSSFFLDEINQRVPLDVLLGLNVNKLDIVYRNDEYLDDLPPRCLIIGDDPGSGMIVLMNNDDFSGVYYWDHSLCFSQSDEENNIYFIADTFTEFINSLKPPADK